MDYWTNRLLEAIDRLASHGDSPNGPGHRLILTVDVDELERLAAEVRTALAQPEPQGVSDEELKNLANKAWISVDALKEYDLIENAFDCCGFARAVLARWGRAAPAQPEPQGESCPGCEGTPLTGNSPCAVCGQLAQPEPQGLPPRVGHILRLAEIIREVDGSHDKGAAALAEAILSHSGSRWSPTIEPQGPSNEELTWLWNHLQVSRRQLMALRGENCLDDTDYQQFARSVLRRWGHPAIEPVPQQQEVK